MINKKYSALILLMTSSSVRASEPFDRDAARRRLKQAISNAAQHNTARVQLRFDATSKVGTHYKGNPSKTYGTAPQRSSNSDN